jgi:hypothetical protein
MGGRDANNPVHPRLDGLHVYNSSSSPHADISNRFSATARLVSKQNRLSLRTRRRHRSTTRLQLHRSTSPTAPRCPRTCCTASFSGSRPTRSAASASCAGRGGNSRPIRFSPGRIRRARHPHTVVLHRRSHEIHVVDLHGRIFKHLQSSMRLLYFLRAQNCWNQVSFVKNPEFPADSARMHYCKLFDRRSNNCASVIRTSGYCNRKVNFWVEINYYLSFI